MATPLKQGEPGGVVVMHVDITERKLAEERLARINRLFAVLSRVNETIVRIADRQELFEKVCQIAAGEGLFRLAAVMELEEATGAVRPVALAGVEEGYFSEVTINILDPKLNQGTIGTAIRTKVFDVCNDMVNDPRLDAWKASYSRRGYRSVGAFPIVVEGRVPWVLFLLAGEVDYFQSDEIELLTAVQKDLSFAVEAALREEKRRLAEAALGAAQRQQKLILESVGEGIHGLDATGRIVFENPSAAAMFGWHEAEMVGQDAHALIHHHRADGRDYPVGECPIYQTLRDGKTRRIEGEIFFRKDGSSFPVEYTSSPVRDETGAISGVVVSFRDVTDRKRAEAVLREQAVLLDNAQRIGRMGSWSFEVETNRLTWSQATCALFGISPGEFRETQEHFQSFVLPEDRPMLEAILAKVSPARPYLEVEYRIRRPDGTVRWMFDRGSVEFDAKGVALRRTGMVMDVTERRLAREQVEKSSTLLRIAGKAARLGGWTIDLPDRTLMWSDETCMIHDLPPGYRPTLEEGISMFPPEHRAEIARHVDACARDGTPYEFEVPKITAKGRRIWVRSMGEAVRDAEGKIIRLQGAFQDITERKLAELELARSNRSLRMLSACGELLIHATEESRLLAETCRVIVELGGYRMAWVGYARLDADRSIEPMAHAGAEEGYLSLARLTWSEEHPAGRGPAGQAIRTGQPAVCANVAGDASFIHWHVEALARGFKSIICLPLRGENTTFGLLGLYSGEVNQAGADELKLLQELADDLAFGIINLRHRDERRKAQREAAQKAALLDLATDAIIVRDLEHRVNFWNKGAERIYGWQAEEIAGLSTSSLLGTDYLAFESAMKAVLKHGEWTGTMQKKNRAGQALTVDCRWTLVRDDAGKPVSVLCIETNITEKKKLEAQFLRTQRMESIGTLAGGIAHDLNNVLSPIMVSIQVLKESGDKAETLKILDTLETCVKRGADLVKQVLSFARGIEGQRVPVNLKKLLGELQHVMREVFPKNVEIEIGTAEDVWMVLGDPTQLHQVLLNLCVNARDAMPQGGKLSVSAENKVLDETYVAMNPESKAGAYVLLNVADSGTGIPAEVLDKVFEPFFTTKEQGKGTGLGLSTALGIVKSHGGFINVESEAGKGTQFKVFLPANAVKSESDTTRIAKKGLPRGNGELILLVDDEQSIRDIVRKTLERFGYRVLVAPNGAEAVALYAPRQKEIAMVITDVSMPIMDGAALVLALKAINPRVRILVSSGLQTSEAVTKAINAGIQRFIPKPYSADQLLMIVHEELGKRD